MFRSYWVASGYQSETILYIINNKVLFCWSILRCLFFCCIYRTLISQISVSRWWTTKWWRRRRRLAAESISCLDWVCIFIYLSSSFQRPGISRCWLFDGVKVIVTGCNLFQVKFLLKLIDGDFVYLQQAPFLPIVLQLLARLLSQQSESCSPFITRCPGIPTPSTILVDPYRN